MVKPANNPANVPVRFSSLNFMHKLHQQNDNRKDIEDYIF